MGRKLRYLGPSEIERLHNEGVPAAIAERFGSHIATIYKELPESETQNIKGGFTDFHLFAARGVIQTSSSYRYGNSKRERGSLSKLWE